MRASQAIPPLAAQVPYWDRVAWSAEFDHPLDAQLLESLVPADARVLDLGCGYGRLTAELRRRGFERVVGVDASPEMIRRGRALHPGTQLFTVRGGVLPFWERSFDAVLAVSVLGCVPADEELRELVGEVLRVLEPGGIVYVSELVLQDGAEEAARYEDGEARYGVRGVFELPEGVVLRHFPEEGLAELLSPFEPLHRASFEAPGTNGHPARGLQLVGRAR